MERLKCPILKGFSCITLGSVYCPLIIYITILPIRLLTNNINKQDVKIRQLKKMFDRAFFFLTRYANFSSSVFSKYYKQ